MTKVHGEQIDLASLATELAALGLILTTPTISIVIEDGTVVYNANSYASVQETVTYAAVHNVSIGSNSDTIIKQLVVAADYIDNKEQAFQGKRVDPAQMLCWPRTGVSLFDEDVSSITIPHRVKQAQMELVLAQAQNVTLTPAGTRSNVKRERITRDFEIEFFNSSDTPKLTTVDRLLRPLYSSRGLGLQAVRG